MKVTVGRRYSISAGHKLRDYEYCAVPHGHNYMVELYATYDLEDPSTPFDNNMIVDFATLKRDLDQVIGICDQKFLNDIYDEPNATAEFVVTRWLQELNRLNPHYTKLRVGETENSFVEATIS